MVVHRDGPQQWSVEHRQLHRSTLLSGGVQLHIAPWLNPEEIRQAYICAGAVTEIALDMLPFWSPFEGQWWQLVMSLEDANRNREEPADFEDDPARWVAHHLVLPALKWHLQALPSVDDEVDDDAAQAFASDVLRVATSPNLRYVSLVPLSGVDLAEATGGVLTEADTTIRRLSDVDQAMWFNESGGLTPSVFSSYEPPSVVLELRTTGPRNAQHMSVSARVPSLITAFHLHGHQVAGKFAAEHSDPRWVFPGAGHSPLTLPGRAGGSNVLTADDVTLCDRNSRSA